MKRISLLFPTAFCLFAAIAWSAAPGAPVDQLVTMARAVPPEFSAEGLIRIASMESVDKARKSELLEEAFRKAGEAALPYKRRAATSKVPGPAGILTRVYAQELDGMSLRLKAVNAMLAIDPAKAREMFQRIPPMKLPPLTCSDFMVYDASGFYSTLTRLAQSYTPAETEKGDAYRLILPYLSGVTSAVQMGPAARVIADFKGSDKEFAALMSVFGKTIAQIGGDDRSFTASAVGPQIRAMTEASKQRKIPFATFLESYRTYIVMNMSTARCADDDLLANEGMSFAFADSRLAEQQGDAVTYFNNILRVPPLKEIDELESTPSKLEGMAVGLRGCDDTTCQDIVKMYSDLILDSARVPYPLAHKQTAEWAEQFQKVITAIGKWQPISPSDAAVHFREKSTLYSDLASVAPTAAGREAVLRAELAYVLKDKAAAQNGVEWMLPVNALIGRVTLDPIGLSKLGEDLRKTDDPVVRLFAELDAVAPRSPAQIMALI